MADCCDEKKSKGEKESGGFLKGLFYGLLPHTGCIAFIIFAILGVTTATMFFKPLLLNPYFFYILILLSFVFATISAIIYLKRGGLLSLKGVKKKWKYLSVLYGASIGANLILFLLIFPIAANITMATGAVVLEDLSEVSLKVDIPCPGHAPLISGELYTISGVKSVKFRFPDYFDVYYDESETSQDEIFSLDVFDIYPAVKISGAIQENVVERDGATIGCSKCSGCSGDCGGYCTL